MPLPSFLKPKDKKPAPRRAAAAASAGSDEAVQQARTRARRRLIGAVVLLAVGLVGFPLVFETQPRPVAVDIPIEPPPSAKPVPAKPPLARASAPAPVVAAPAEVIEEPAPKTAEKAVEKPAAPTAVATAPSVPAAKPAPPPAKIEDSARAKALLEDQAAKPAAAGRYVVQVGAFSDAEKLREARQKVEKLGLKTYTQVVETEAGKRTRVRVGPFATRDEADSAGAKLKAAGLPAAVLTL